MNYDCIVVGCGFCGSVIARFVAEELGWRVLVLERRNHIAGNMYDYTDENDIRVQKYGPHTFHTSQHRLFEYILRFGSWGRYELKCMAQIDGVFTFTPFNFKTIDQFYAPKQAQDLKDRIAYQYPGAETETILNLLRCDDPVIRQYAQFLFDKDYSLYTAKQWGISPMDIDVSVLQRVPVRFSYGEKYFDDPYQVMPVDGFTALFENILDHSNITVELNVEAKTFLSVDTKEGLMVFNGEVAQVPIVYTGALDHLLDYRFGPLPYRSLRFDMRCEPVDSYQPAPVIAYPQAESFTRITEYTKLPFQKSLGRTVIAVEYPLQYVPGAKDDPYYPILTDESIRQHRLYSQSLTPVCNLFTCGRLADFRYYNMDQALDKALGMCDTLKQRYVGQDV